LWFSEKVGSEYRWKETGQRVNFLGGKRESSDERYIDTCLREFWEESGSLLSTQEQTDLRQVFLKRTNRKKEENGNSDSDHLSNIATLWASNGKYVLLLLLLSEDVENEQDQFLPKELLNKLKTLDTLYNDPDNYSLRGAHAEMESLVWISLQTIFDTFATSPNKKEKGEQLKNHENFEKTEAQTITSSEKTAKIFELPQEKIEQILFSNFFHQVFRIKVFQTQLESLRKLGKFHFD